MSNFSLAQTIEIALRITGMRELVGESRGYDTWERNERLSRTVKALRLVPFFHAKKFACHNLMDAGRTHKTSGSEAKDFFTYSNSSSSKSIGIFLCWFLSFPKDNAKRARWHLYTQWDILQERNPKLREPDLKWWAVSMPAHCSKKDTISNGSQSRLTRHAEMWQTHG